MNKYESALIEITLRVKWIGLILMLLSFVLALLCWGYDSVFGIEREVGEYIFKIIESCQMIVFLMMGAVLAVLFPWLASTTVCLLLSLFCWYNEFNLDRPWDIIAAGVAILLLVFSIYKSFRSPINPILFK